MKTTDLPVIVTQLFDKSVSEVWKAITEQDQMIQWFFKEIPDFKAVVGFKTQFNVHAPSRDFIHLWKVTEVIHQEKIVCNWKYEGFDGDSYITFDIIEVNNQTQLTLTTKVVEDFDDIIPEFNRKSCNEGWNYFIKERLFLYLNA